METKERTIFVDKNINYRLLERYPAKALTRVLLNKIARRVIRYIRIMPPLQRAVLYNGLLVFDSADLDGEGTTVGQDFCRVLLELGLQRCERIFEFCAGPGYIGYSLLANGFCEKLTLTDINPKAIAAARKTAEFNKIEHLVNIYQSDVLSQIPESEQWDLVVGNPPHFLPGSERDVNIKAYDPGWEVHRRFYSSVRKFMKPKGYIVMQENVRGSYVDLFKPWIEEGGGRLVTSRPGINICGDSNSMYYVVSQW